METSKLYEIKDDLKKLILQVGEIVEQGYHEEEKNITTKKNDNDILTKYDLKSNQIIVEHLEKNYPKINIISEEQDDIDKNSEYTFHIDPIDGTKNFSRKNPIFHIGIGLAKNNKTILCLTYSPIIKDLFWAIKGEGAYQNDKKIKVIERPIENCDIQIHLRITDEINSEVITQIYEKVYSLRSDVCAHYCLSGVSNGRFDGSICRNAYSWDYVHYLLVEEAGGIVTDFKGEEFNLTKRDIIATNKTIHTEILKLIYK